MAETLSTEAACREPAGIDLIIELYKKDVDLTLLRENLKLTPQQRLEKFERFREYADELREAGRRARMRDVP